MLFSLGMGVSLVLLLLLVFWVLKKTQDTTVPGRHQDPWDDLD
jgi:hypothetical protein